MTYDDDAGGGGDDDDDDDDNVVGRAPCPGLLLLWRVPPVMSGDAGGDRRSHNTPMHARVVTSRARQDRMELIEAEPREAEPDALRRGRAKPLPHACHEASVDRAILANFAPCWRSVNLYFAIFLSAILYLFSIRGTRKRDYAH